MAEKPKVRVLACAVCHSLEELPFYEGPVAHDELLAAAVKRHEFPSGDRHIGQLFVVDEEHWHLKDTREQIRKQIQAALDPDAETGLGSEAYAMVDNFRADAMSCWESHMRTPDCNDYKSPAKRLVPDTANERREMGLSPVASYDAKDRSMTRYLCEYCPVHSLVQQAARKKAGLYDK